MNGGTYTINGYVFTLTWNPSTNTFNVSSTNPAIVFLIGAGGATFGGDAQIQTFINYLEFVVGLVQNPPATQSARKKS